MDSLGRWELPERFGKPSTMHRRLCQCAEDGTLLHLCRTFLIELDEEGMIRWNERFIDGTFILAKRGLSSRQKPGEAGVQSLRSGALRATQMTRVFRFGVHVDVASPAGVTLVNITLESLDETELSGQPEHLIADKVYESNLVREQLVNRGIEPIISARANN